MRKYRILTFDGGGVRGVYSAVLLQRLVALAGNFLPNVDLIAGTSTGGLIALGLAGGLSPVDLVVLYRDNADRIFDDSWLDDLTDLGKIVGADYDNRELKKVAIGLFGDTRLKHLKMRVLVPTFDLDNVDDPRAKKHATRMWKAKFFHNFPGADSDGEETVVDVAMRTTAAPTYFPSYQGYVDGSVVANNPSLAAIAQALDSKTGKQSLGELRLLSIGTGLNPERVEGKNHDWGFAQWAKPLVTLMIDAAMGVSDYQCRRLLEDRYLRLEPVLPERIPLDDVDKVARLIELASTVPLVDCDGNDAVAWVRSNFM
jgi:uncharacterized protein